MFHRPLWLLGLALVLIALLYQWPHTHHIDIGSSTDEALIQGFYFSEQVGESTFRWSSDLAQVRFPGIASRDWHLHLRASGTRPNPPATLIISDDDHNPLATLQLSGEMAEYTIPLENLRYDLGKELGNVDGSYQLNLETSTFSAPPDTRALGFQLDWIELRPSTDSWLSGLVIPPLYPWLGMSLVVGLLAAAGQRLGLHGRRWQFWNAMWLLLILLALLIANLWVGLYLRWIVAGALIFWLISRWMRDAKAVEWVLLGVVAFAGINFTVRAIDFYNNNLPPGDFTIYFEAASKLRQDQPIYDFKAASEMPNGPVYKYPPLFAIVLSPFTLFPVWNVAAGWYLLNLALYVLIFRLTLSLVMQRTFQMTIQQRHIFVLLCALLFLLFQPSWESLIRGQLDVLILSAAMVGLWCYQRRQHEWIGGVLLAFVTMLKLYPGLLVLYLVWQRRISALTGFGLSFVLLTLVSGMIAGWEVMWRYVSEVLTVQTAAVPWPENQSWTGFLSRFVIPAAETTWYTTIPFAPSVRWLLYSLVLLTLAITALVMWKKTESKNNPTFPLAYFIQGYFLTILVMLLLWPTSWIHYQTLLLPSFSLLLYSQFDPARRRWWRIALLALSFGLIAFGNEYTVLTPELNVDSWQRLLQSYKFYGMVILWALHLTDREQ